MRCALETVGAALERAVALPPLPGGCIGVLATLLGHGKADWVKNVPGWAGAGWVRSSQISRENPLTRQAKRPS